VTVYLPDTGILIDVLNGRANRKSLLLDIAARGHSLACCAVTVAELYSGLHQNELDQALRLLSALIWVDTTPAVAKRAGEIRYAWARKGKTLGLADTMIAATALQYNLTLITENRKDFPMPELQIHPLK
jgi:predicted nucleic acid-binding protein